MHWLSWKCGLDLRAARDMVRVAGALGKLPRISTAMANGQLSYSKARALTRIATEATEEMLLKVALHGTTEHVEELVRRFREAQEVKEISRVERQYAHRNLSHAFDEDGSLVLKVRLPAESGLLVLKALETALPDIPWPDEAPPHERVMAESRSFHGAGDIRKPPLTRTSSPSLGDSQELLDGSAEPSSRARPSALQPSPVSFGARRAVCRCA